MPTLREIKGHINSVNSIAKVTRALEMVSAAKSHRLQARVTQTFPYANRSWELLQHLGAAVNVQQQLTFVGHKEIESIGLLLITSNQGMVGAYNYQVIESANRYIETQQVPVKLITIGKMGRQAMLGEERTIHADFSQIEDDLSIEAIEPVARLLTEGFEQGTFGRVMLAYTQFQSGTRLQPVVRQLLPLLVDQPPAPRQYYYDPDAHQLLEELVPRIIRSQVYQVLLESLAAEHTARAAAMHSATENAGDLIHGLELSRNKARQQTITAELLDIVGGSDMLAHDRE
jgi:F-type H+-transporting ATPase subunit gamma